MSLYARIIRRVRVAQGGMRERFAGGRERQLFVFAAGFEGGRAGPALYGGDARFRRAADACGRVLEAELGMSPRELLHYGGADAWLATARAGVVQTALFDAWRAGGIRPAGVLGAGSGEAVAAYAAGALSRDDALAVICRFGRRAGPVPAGDLLLVGADAHAAKRLARASVPAEFIGEAYPGASLIWLPRAGRACVESRAPVLAELSGTGCGLARRAALEEDLGGISWRRPSCAVYSAAAGGLIAASTPRDAAFWAWTLSAPFDFGSAAADAFSDGMDVALGAGPAALAWMAESARRSGHPLRTLDLSDAGALKRARRMPRPAPPEQAPFSATDLHSAAATREPYACYEELRQGGPVQYLPRHDFWIVLGHAEVQAAFSRPSIFSSSPWKRVDPVLAGSDPPMHAAVRRLVAREFAPVRLDRIIAFVEERARELLRPELDVVGDWGVPLTQSVGGILLGADEDLLAEIAAAGEASPEPSSFPVLHRALRALAGRTGLYGTLMRDGAGMIGDEEARSLVALLWLAATTTTPRTIAFCVIHLLRDGALRRRLASDPALIPAFVDEVLRLHPAEHLIRRRATVEAELGGVLIPEGATVQLCITAANRDPARFEAPAELRIDRSPPRHLSMGHGIHYCVGAPLARRVVATALRTLLREMPYFRELQPLGAVPYFRSMTAYTPRQLVIEG